MPNFNTVGIQNNLPVEPSHVLQIIESLTFTGTYSSVDFYREGRTNFGANSFSSADAHVEMHDYSGRDALVVYGDITEALRVDTNANTTINSLTASAANITAGTVGTLSSTTATVSTVNATNATITTAAITNGTVTNLSSTEIIASRLTGSLSGNASTATTASYVQTAQTASYVAAASINGTVANATTASYALVGATASFVTASNVHGPHGTNSVISASHAVTASYAINFAGNGLPVGNIGELQYNFGGGDFGAVPTLTYSGSLLRATGSFTGSFTGDGSGLTNLPISFNSSSFITTGSDGSQQQITGSLIISGSAARLTISGSVQTNKAIYADTLSAAYSFQPYNGYYGRAAVDPIDPSTTASAAPSWFSSANGASIAFGGPGKVYLSDQGIGQIGLYANGYFEPWAGTLKFLRNNSLTDVSNGVVPYHLLITNNATLLDSQATFATVQANGRNHTLAVTGSFLARDGVTLGTNISNQHYITGSITATGSVVVTGSVNISGSLDVSRLYTLDAGINQVKANTVNTFPPLVGSFYLSSPINPFYVATTTYPYWTPTLTYNQLVMPGIRSYDNGSGISMGGGYTRYDRFGHTGIGTFEGVYDALNEEFTSLYADAIFIHTTNTALTPPAPARSVNRVVISDNRTLDIVSNYTAVSNAYAANGRNHVLTVTGSFLARDGATIGTDIANTHYITGSTYATGSWQLTGNLKLPQGAVTAPTLVGSTFPAYTNQDWSLSTNKAGFAVIQPATTGIASLGPVGGNTYYWVDVNIGPDINAGKAGSIKIATDQGYPSTATYTLISYANNVTDSSTTWKTANGRDHALTVSGSLLARDGVTIGTSLNNSHYVTGSMLFEESSSFTLPTTASAAPTKGTVYFDFTSNKLYAYNGASWVTASLG